MYNQYYNLGSWLEFQLSHRYFMVTLVSNDIIAAVAAAAVPVCSI